jgi:hypothetical protein
LPAVADNDVGALGAAAGVTETDVEETESPEEFTAFKVIE